MTPAFGGPLDIRQTNSRRWITLAPLVYTSAVASQIIVVPAEFITDLASVPRLPLAYLLAGDRARGPAVIHDYLYQHPEWVDRALADAVFLEAMGVDQPELGHEAEAWWLRQTMYLAVRAAGWASWNKDSRPGDMNPEWTHAGWPPASEEAA